MQSYIEESSAPRIFKAKGKVFQRGNCRICYFDTHSMQAKFLIFRFAQAIAQAQRPRYMCQIFVEEGKDRVLLIDASNAFNQMNRSVAIHNIQITCNEINVILHD